MDNIENVVSMVMGNSVELPVDQINLCIEELNLFMSTPDCVVWSIDNFGKFKFNDTNLFAILTIRDWIINHWDEVSCYYDQVRTLLFDKAPNNMDTLKPSYSFALIRSQVYFLYHSYPQMWPNFFLELIKRDFKIVVLFLSELFADMKENKSTFNEITASMQVDQSDVLLMNYVLNGMCSGVESCFELLVDMLNWTEPTPILEHQALDIIIDSFISNENLATNDDENYEGYEILLNPKSKLESSIQILDAIVKSPINPDHLCTIIIQHSIIERLDSLYDKASLHILSISGSLLASICFKWMEFGIPPPLDIALKYLSHNDESVSDTVIGFIIHFVKNDINTGKNIASVLFLRYSAFFYDEPVEKSEFAENLLSLISFILRSDNNFRDGFISDTFSVLSLNSIEHLPTIIGFLHIILPIQNIPSIDIIISSLLPLLYIESPMSRIEYLAYTPFVEFLIKKGRNYSQDVIQTVFDTLINHAINNQNPEDFLPKISQLLLTFVRDKSLTVFVSPNIPSFLVGTLHIGYTCVASKLLSRISHEDQEESFASCVSTLEEFINSSYDQRTAIDRVLLFVEHLVFDRNNVLCSQIKALLKSIFPSIVNDDVLFSRYIMASKPYLVDDIEHFLQIIEKIHGMESASQISQIALSILEKNNDHSWINCFYSKLLPLIIKFLDQVSDWTNNSEETVQGKAVQKHLFRFSSKSVPYMNEEILTMLFDTISLFLQPNSWDPDLSYEALSILIEIPSSFSLLLIQNYSDLISSILQCSYFIPKEAKWRRIMRQIVKLHGKLYNENTQAFINSLSTSFQSTSYSGLLSEYLILIEKGVSQNDSEVASFFSNFDK